jgi:hypothetical protein
MRRWILSLLAVALTLASTGTALAQARTDPAAAGVAPTEATASARVIPSVVRIKTSEGSGTGFTVGDSLLVSNNHVVGDDSTISIETNDGRQLEGSVVSKSRLMDLALIRAEGLNLPAVAFADLSQMRAGDTVVAIGYPLGLSGDPTITRGVYSAVRVAGGEVTGEWVQTDAAINPGNSGGPLVNLQGEVVGMNSWVIRQLPDMTPIEGIKFALSANSIQEDLPALLVDAGLPIPGATEAAPEVNQEVQDFLQQFDAVQSEAMSKWDASLLNDYEGPALHARTITTINNQKARDLRQESKLLKFELRAAYQLPNDLLVADVFEVWESKLFQGDKLFRDEGQIEEPQLCVLRRTAAGLRQVAVQFQTKAEPEAPAAGDTATAAVESYLGWWYETIDQSYGGLLVISAQILAATRDPNVMRSASFRTNAQRATSLLRDAAGQMQNRKDVPSEEFQQFNSKSVKLGSIYAGIADDWQATVEKGDAAAYQRALKGIKDADTLVRELIAAATDAESKLKGESPRGTTTS